MTVLSKDITTIPEDEIPTAQVSYTIVGGKVLYERDKGQVGKREQGKVKSAFPLSLVPCPFRDVSVRLRPSRVASRVPVAAACGGETDRRIGHTRGGIDQRAVDPRRPEPDRAGSMMPAPRARLQPWPAISSLLRPGHQSYWRQAPREAWRRAPARSWRGGGDVGEEALDALAQLHHLLAVRFHVQFAAFERFRVANQESLERGHEAAAQRIGAVAYDGRGLVPPVSERSDALQHRRVVDGEWRRRRNIRHQPPGRAIHQRRCAQRAASASSSATSASRSACFASSSISSRRL